MFKDIQQFALQAARDACSGKINSAGALSAAALLKTLNDNIDTEIAYHRLAIQAKEAKYDLMALVQQPPVIEHQAPATDGINTSALSAALDTQDVVVAPKKRPPNILVLGMRPTQLGRVAEKLNGTTDLFSWTTDDGLLVLRSLAKKADLIIVAAGGAVNHSDTEALSRDGITWTKAQNSHASVLSAIKDFFINKDTK